VKVGEIWKVTREGGLAGIFYCKIVKIFYKRDKFGPDIYEDYWIECKPLKKDLEKNNDHCNAIYPREIFLSSFQFFATSLNEGIKLLENK